MFLLGFVEVGTYYTSFMILTTRDSLNSRNNLLMSKRTMSFLRPSKIDKSSFIFSMHFVIVKRIFLLKLLIDRMQVHFENIQRIANTMTLPHTMLYLSSRVAEELDLLHLTERLIKGKGQTNSSEKLELWDRLKILSMHMLSFSTFNITFFDS